MKTDRDTRLFSFTIYVDGQKFQLFQWPLYLKAGSVVVFEIGTDDGIVSQKVDVSELLNKVKVDTDDEN